jgi:hypothetical protein
MNRGTREVFSCVTPSTRWFSVSNRQSEIHTIAYCLVPVSAESAKGRISPKLNG